MYITCDLLGPGDGQNFGLCNQMFQIAAITSHAIDCNYTATFPQIKLKSFGEYNKNIFQNVVCDTVDTTNFEYKVFDYGYHQLPHKPNIVYRGYFQSEKYFAHNRQAIKNLFTLPQHYLDYVMTKYGSVLQGETLSIHVRRGDYVNLPNHHPLADMDYYKSAIDHILGKVAITKYVVFSDDINWCINTFGYDDNIVYISDEADFIDLYIMSLCKHNIIANSTFSWWGAWLNDNDSKIVVAPDKWFGSARSDLNTKDLIPETWIKI